MNWIEKLTQYRRHLHQIPELGFDLPLTYQYIKDKLISFGYAPKTYAKTGLVAVKPGSTKNTYAFRSDMDGLPVTEKTNLPFASKHLGQMHACGHDGHMAMLLGFAEWIAGQDTLKSTVMFIFQPAEEGPGGAKVMLEEGIFDGYDVKGVFGLHLFPGIYEDYVGIKSGAMLAQNGEFDIKVIGASSHGAQPHLGKDAILAASQIVSMIHHIVSRYINPLDPAVITVGTINGGEARNIIAGNVSLSGTIRAFSNDVYQNLKQQIINMSQVVKQAYGVDIVAQIVDFYPAVVNDDALYQVVKSSLDAKQTVILEPYMIAEDFAFYQQKVPGVFSFIGTKNDQKGYVYPLHSDHFDFDERILVNGLNYYINLSKSLNIV